MDYRNYENDGKWYIFLDEAHKGDKRSHVEANEGQGDNGATAGRTLGPEGNDHR